MIYGVTWQHSLTSRNNTSIVISMIDEIVRDKKEGKKGEWRKRAKDLTRKSSYRSKPDVLHVLPAPSFLPQFTPFSPDSSTRAVVSPARLSRMLTVIRSRIISVIIAQPDAGSVAYIFSMYNQWFISPFPPPPTVTDDPFLFLPLL